MRDGHGRWLPSQSQELMGLTLKALDSVTADDELSPSWTFGGGTSLAIDLAHRVRYDIDASLDSATIIQRLVPVRNLATRAMCWNDETQRPDYHFPGHYLKLVVKGVGEIYFLSASALLEGSTVPFDFDGRVIERERPAEIIAKKIFYRGATFKSHDVFDLAGTYVSLPEELEHAATSPFLTEEVFSRVKFRIETRAHALSEEMVEEVNPTEFGRSFIDDACSIALEALDFMENRPRNGL
jgi:hypothetical protein